MTTEIWLRSLVSVGIVSLISLIGVFTLVVGETRLTNLRFWLMALGVGALFGDVIFHLLPEAFQKIGGLTGLYVAAGFALFYLLEKVLHWRHRHVAHQLSRIEPVGWLNLIADGIHNFVDGMLIGASYVISIPTGFAATLAVVLHEIPQELADYGILRVANFSKWGALGWNFLSGIVAVVGTIFILSSHADVAALSVPILAFTAGGFIYMILILLRKLGEELTVLRAVAQLAMIGVGLLAMYLITFLD